MRVKLERRLRDQLTLCILQFACHLTGCTAQWRFLHMVILQLNLSMLSLKCTAKKTKIKRKHPLGDLNKRAFSTVGDDDSN